MTAALRTIGTVTHKHGQRHLFVVPDTAEAPGPGSLMEAAVSQAITAMREDLMCEHGIGGIAADTYYSKFHFTREFARITGTTPRRFLASLRMEKAKDLLLNSSWGIADVSTMVGYSSVGTFSTRFSELVGVGPRAWRQSGGRVDTHYPHAGQGAHMITGRVEAPDYLGPLSPIAVGVYPDAVAQGAPVASDITLPGDAFELAGVPTGDWCIIAYAATGEGLANLRACVPVTVTQGRGDTLGASVELRPEGPLDPPVVFEGYQLHENWFADAMAAPRQSLAV